MLHTLGNEQSGTAKAASYLRCGPALGSQLELYKEARSRSPVMAEVNYRYM